MSQFAVYGHESEILILNHKLEVVKELDYHAGYVLAAIYDNGKLISGGVDKTIWSYDFKT